MLTVHQRNGQTDGRTTSIAIRMLRVTLPLCEGGSNYHVMESQPQFAFSVYNYYGATMTTKGSLHVKISCGRDR